MAMNYKEIVDRLPREYKTGGILVNALVDSLLETSMLPAVIAGEVFIPKIPLKPIWNQQARTFIELGFHEYLKMDEEEYLGSLPLFTRQPSHICDLPVIRETRVPQELQAEKIGKNPAIVFDIVDTPEVPYTAWFNPVFYMRKSYSNSQPAIGMEKAISDIPTSQEGATYGELISLLIHYPNIFSRSGSHPNETQLLLTSGSRGKDTLNIPGHYGEYHNWGLTTRSLSDLINSGHTGGLLLRDQRISTATQQGGSE